MRYRPTQITAHVVGGPYCGGIKVLANTNEPVLFTEVLSYTAPLDPDKTFEPPKRVVSILPAWETLPNGETRWVLRWPPLQAAGAAA